MESDRADGQGRGGFGAAIALYESLLTRSPNDHELKFNLAYAQLDLTGAVLNNGEWAAAYRGAARMAAEAVAADPKNPEYRFLQAQIFVGQQSMWGLEGEDNIDTQQREPRYAAQLLCAKTFIQRMVERTSDDPLQYRIADILTTAPAPLRDPALALKLARRAVELKPGEAICTQSLGWALYRKGDLPGSIEALQKTSDGGERDFVRAMIHWQLGEKTEARASFDGAIEQLKSHEPRYEENLKQGILTFPLPAQLKRQQEEATALLGVTPPTVEPAPEPAAKVEETKEPPKSTPTPEPAKDEETLSK